MIYKYLLKVNALEFAKGIITLGHLVVHQSLYLYLTGSISAVSLFVSRKKGCGSVTSDLNPNVFFQ